MRSIAIALTLAAGILPAAAQSRPPPRDCVPVYRPGVGWFCVYEGGRG